MSEPKKTGGCLAFCMVVLILGFFAWVVFRVTETIESDEHVHKSGHMGEPIGPAFTTMDDQLEKAREGKQKITQIRLEGSPGPIDGPWDVKEVGYDVVLLEGPGGAMTLRIEKIVGILVAPRVQEVEATKPAQAVEK